MPLYMKKTLLSIFVLLFITFCNAQTTFNWASSIGPGMPSLDNISTDIATDAAGNIYTVGLFHGTVDVDPGPGVYNFTAADGEDTYILKQNAAGDFVWAAQIGGLYDQYGYGITVDASSNVYISGYFSDMVDFDPGPGTYYLTAFNNNHSSDAYVLKLDAAGNFAWVSRFGGLASEIAWHVALDQSNNVYMTGYFSGTADFDPGPGTQNLTATGFNDIFIVKLDADGNYAWAKNFGAASYYCSGYTINTDAAGNVYTSGNFYGTVDFDPGPGTQNLVAGAYQNIFILKLDSDGNYIWAKAIGNPGFGRIQALTVDAAQNIYTTGSYYGTIDFDPGPGTKVLTPVGFHDIFIFKLDASGNLVWANSIGGNDSDGGNDITLDRSNNVYITGNFYESFDFDPGPGTQTLSAAGGVDAFIMKMDAAGNFIWAQQFGGTSNEGGYGIALNNNTLSVTGHYSGTADFDPGTTSYELTSASGVDGFILSLNLPIPLPLTLLQFQAFNKINEVMLQWQSTAEINTASFTIERSADGKKFNAIGSIAAMNNSTLTNTYTFTDAQPLTGIGYYRLKMIDANEQFTYTKTVSVRRTNSTNTFQVYPNPVQNSLHVQVSGNEPVTWQITNTNGRVIQQQSIMLNGNTSFTINTQQLPAGNFYLILKGKHVQQVQSFFKQP